MSRTQDHNTESYFRTDRMFREGEHWYFTTREGEMMGPFEDELEAATQLEVYIRLAKSGLLPARSELNLEPVAARSTG